MEQSVKAKAKGYAMQFLVVFAAVITATWAIQQWNKPRTAAPKTAQA